VRRGLKHANPEHFKDFLTDTALFGGDHVPIDSDAPFDLQTGPLHTRDTFAIIEAPSFTATRNACSAWRRDDGVRP
jgi:hypothetical protein